MRFLRAQHGHVTAPSDLIGSAHVPVDDIVHPALRKAEVLFTRLLKLLEPLLI